MTTAGGKLNLGETAILRLVKRSNPFRGSVDELASDLGISATRAWNALLALERQQLVRISRTDYGLAVRPAAAGQRKRTR